MHARFSYLQQGLAVILAFVGVKMMIAEWYHIPTWLSLAVIAIVLAVSIVHLAAGRPQRGTSEALGASTAFEPDAGRRVAAPSPSSVRRRDVRSRLARDGDRRRGHRTAAVDGVDRRRRSSSTSR